MSNNALLFACSKCFSKHPFDELSSGQQLCKECRGAYIKCTYCRSEFQQAKLSTSSICSKCESNVKQFGKPSACEYCNIIAAFIGNKCQRCTNSERKYGAPVTCEQCKQKCAFDRKDDDKKVQVDGKLLCWLCTLSYKRALAKTKHQSESERRAQMKISSSSQGGSSRPGDKRSRDNRSGRSGGGGGGGSSSKRPSSGRPSELSKLEPPLTGLEGLPPVAKAMRRPGGGGDLALDPSSSDHVVAMTTLKEKMASLQKQIVQKDAQLLAKDKMICELKAKHFTNETELRSRMQNTERDFEKKVETLSHKIKSLQKEVATLSKSNKVKGRKVEKKEEEASASGGAGSGGSGTDSPLP